MWHKRIYLLLLLTIFCNWFKLTGHVLDAGKIESTLTIEPYLSVYTGNSENPAVIATASDGNFNPYSWKMIPEGNSSSWLRLQILNSDSVAQNFILGNNQFEFLEFYEPTENDSYKLKLSGTLCNHNLMSIVFGANSWFHLVAEKNKVNTYLIHASNTKKINYQYSKQNFTIYKESVFDSYRSQQLFFNYFFCGAILIITFYNLMLFFQLKGRIYLLYVCNNLIILLFVLSQSGWIDEFFLKNSRFHEQLLLVVGNIAFIFYILFCKEYLNLAVTRPRLNRIFNWILRFYPAPLVLVALNYSDIAVSIGGLIAIWGYTMVMVTTYRFIKSGDLSARFFFIANVFYYVGIIISILQTGGLLPFAFLGLYAVNYVQLGTLFQLSLFSLTVGFRIIKMQQEIIAKELEQERIKREEEQLRRILIEEQNTELEKKVDERTSDLNIANRRLQGQSEILEKQKFMLEERQKEIIDSITYAKYIQYALLAHSDFLKQNLPAHFILFQPKDIVSGDFYWAAKKDNRFYFAICDCTGHGVPGAFMSLLNVSFLNEAINEKEIIAPNEILNYVRTKLVSSLAHQGHMDGMDGTLVCFTEESTRITYASAYNKPLLIRNNTILALEADKMPVGKGEKLLSFTHYELDLEKGDVIYFYTDGFADQFGGPLNKKFKYKALNDLLLSISVHPPNEQELLLKIAFENWKGNEEQIDDVCIAGIVFS